MVGSSSGVETSRISPQASSGRRTRPERLIGCWQKWAYSTCLHQRPVFAGPFDELGSELVGELVTKDGVGRAPLAAPRRGLGPYARLMEHPTNLDELAAAYFAHYRLLTRSHDRYA